MSENEHVIHLAYLIDELENDGPEVSNICMSHFESTAYKVIEYARELIEDKEDE